MVGVKVKVKVEPDEESRRFNPDVVYIFLKPDIPLWQYSLYTLGRLISFFKRKRVVRWFRDHVLGYDPRCKGRLHIGQRVVCDYLVALGILTGAHTIFAMMLIFALTYYLLHKPRRLRDIGVKLAGLFTQPY